MEDKMKATVTFTVSFPIEVKKEVQYYLASCPTLDVWACGNTQKSAVDNLKDTLQLFLTHCFDKGTLEIVLKGCGFTSLKKSLRRDAAYKIDDIDVPLPFVIDQPLAN
jgi:predicted RNase H-like HicB family nuclease